LIESKLADIKLMNFTPFPERTTERLHLRKIEDSDCNAVLFLRSHKTINKFIQRPESEQTKNSADALAFIKKIAVGIDRNEFISWAITLKNSPEMIGTICLWNFSNDRKTAEVGYDLDPIFQGKGIMSEALKSIVNFGHLELNLDQVEAFTHRDNENSKTLLINNGFTLNENRRDVDAHSNLIFEIKNPSANIQ
jgi:ribosomal-protein-alanine N-acetyltransferase